MNQDPIWPMRAPTFHWLRGYPGRPTGAMVAIGDWRFSFRWKRRRFVWCAGPCVEHLSKDLLLDLDTVRLWLGYGRTEWRHHYQMPDDFRPLRERVRLPKGESR